MGKMKDLHQERAAINVQVFRTLEDHLIELLNDYELCHISASREIDNYRVNLNVYKEDNDE